MVAGEDSLTGAQRELEEELGIHVEADELKYVFTSINVRNTNSIYDVYEVRWNGDVSKLSLQEGEVVDAKWVGFGELCVMYDEGKVVPQLEYFKEHFAAESAG